MNKKFKYINIDLGIIEAKIPIIEIGKKNLKKSLAITCCIHGNETSSLYIIRNMLQNIKDNNLNGYVKIILISNPIAAFFNSRCSPKDIQDMNRVVPGNNNGTITERICRCILNEILLCDYYIDIHEWSLHSLLQGIVVENNSENIKKISSEMLKVFNPDIVTTLSSKYLHSMYGFLNARKNIPGFVIELSSDTIYDNIKEERVVKSLINVLRYLKISNQEEEKIDKKNYVVIGDVNRYVAQKSGLFFPEKKVGDEIRKGEEIGFILDLDLETKEILYNEENTGLIIQLAMKKMINAGDLIYIVSKNEI